MTASYSRLNSAEEDLLDQIHTLAREGQIRLSGYGGGGVQVGRDVGSCVPRIIVDCAMPYSFKGLVESWRDDLPPVTASELGFRTGIVGIGFEEFGLGKTGRRLTGTV